MEEMVEMEERPSRFALDRVPLRPLIRQRRSLCYSNVPTHELSIFLPFAFNSPDTRQIFDAFCFFFFSFIFPFCFVFRTSQPPKKKKIEFIRACLDRPTRVIAYPQIYVYVINMFVCMYVCMHVRRYLQ